MIGVLVEYHPDYYTDTTLMDYYDRSASIVASRVGILLRVISEVSFTWVPYSTTHVSGNHA